MITAATTQQRQTRYCDAIKGALEKTGHATNNELLAELRKTFPFVSATTVHRATGRLASRGEIGIAPNSKDGYMRYDHIITPHDHFLCSSCGILRDTDVKEKIVPILESSIGDCRISGRLTIGGVCRRCISIERKDNA